MCRGYKRLASPAGWQEFSTETIDGYEGAKEVAWDEFVSDSVNSTLGDEEEAKKVLTFITDNYNRGYNALELSEWLFDKKDEVKSVDPLTLEALSLTLDDFVFPDEDTWVDDEYASAVGDLMDRCYEEERDRLFDD